MAAMRMKRYRIAVKVNSWHFPHECGDGLESDAHDDVFAIADSTLDAARVISHGTYVTVGALFQYIHHFASSLSRHIKTITIFKSMNRWDTHHC